MNVDFVNTSYTVSESGGSVNVSIVLTGKHVIPLKVTVECVEDEPISARGVCACVRACDTRYSYPFLSVSGVQPSLVSLLSSQMSGTSSVITKSLNSHRIAMVKAPP